MEQYHGTTIISVRRQTPEGVQVAIGGDGQVTLGNIVVKGTARKVRKLYHGKVLAGDRKSTRLNSSHLVISYAVFCLKKKKETQALLGSVPQHPHPDSRAFAHLCAYLTCVDCHRVLFGHDYRLLRCPHETV